VRVELYIDRGESEENKKLFDSLARAREKIEAQLGTALEWERLDDRRASRIAVYMPGTIASDQPTLDSIRNWAIAHLLSFRSVFGPLLKEHSK
jgi:hypothetical protein